MCFPVFSFAQKNPFNLGLFLKKLIFPFKNRLPWGRVANMSIVTELFILKEYLLFLTKHHTWVSRSLSTGNVLHIESYGYVYDVLDLTSLSFVFLTSMASFGSI